MSDDQREEIERQREDGYPGQPPNSKYVVEMNESTSDDWDKVPFPARQQMGDHGDMTDARSGNGVNDELQAGFTRGGHTVMPVTYHLEHTPPPSEPMGAPGSDSYNVHARGTEQMAADPNAGFDAVRHPDSGPDSSQREVPGRDARITGAHEVKDETNLAPQTTAPSAASSNNLADESTSSTGANANAAPQEKEVPNSSIQDVLTWVGDDKKRAQAALDAENARPTPRATLVQQLQDKL